VAPVGRQTVAHAVQRLAEPGDISVAENRPAPGNQRLPLRVLLGGQVAHHCLRRGQTNCRGHAASLRAAARALSQIAQRRAKLPAMAVTAAVSSMPPAIQASAVATKMVRPTAKPFTNLCRAASAKLAASSSSPAPRP